MLRNLAALVYNDDIFLLFIISCDLFNLATDLVDVSVDLILQLLEVVLAQEA